MKVIKIDTISKFSCRLGIGEKKLQNLSEYEMVIAAHLVVPDDINVSWRDIAGLDSVSK